VAESAGGFFVEGLLRSPAKLLDRGFKRSEEHFAGFTAIEVLYEFLANRVVQLLVEIVGELREQSLT
jgi:hypothetical protein